MKYSKYSKADEKLVKEFLESMYDKHQQLGVQHCMST